MSNERLAKLERSDPPVPAGYASGRAWSPITLCSDRQPLRPDHGPDCGRHVPIVRILEIIGVDVDRT